MFSLIFILVGIIFLLNTLGYLAGPVWGVIWPALLILAGLWGLFQKQSFVCRDCWTLDFKKTGKKGKK